MAGAPPLSRFFTPPRRPTREAVGPRAPGGLARAEALAVLQRADEGLDHLGVLEVAVEAVQLVEPEVVARGVGVAPQVAEVLHGHEGAVELPRLQLLPLGDLAQHRRARLGPPV